MTIGDFWNMEKSMPDFVDEMGTSLMLIHTEKGRDLFESIEADLEVRQSNTKDCLQMNLQRPTEHSAQRERFWSDYRSSGIEYVMKKYGEVTLAGKVRRQGIGSGTSDKRRQRLVDICDQRHTRGTAPVSETSQKD